MIAEVQPQELTLWFCASGVVVLAWLCTRVRRRQGEDAPAPFGPLEPAVLIGVAFLVLAAYQLCLAFTTPKWSFRAALVAAACGLAVAFGTWWLALRPVFRPRRGVPFRLGAGLLVAWASLPLVYGLAWVVGQLSQPEMQEQVRQLDQRGAGWRNVAVSAVVLAPVFEELIFRGLIYPAVRRMWNVPAAVAISAALFGLVHFPAPVVWAPMAVLGVLFAYLVESTGSLLASIVAHAAFNSLTVAQLIV